jgi:hypothetical protein
VSPALELARSVTESEPEALMTCAKIWNSGISRHATQARVATAKSSTYVYNSECDR